MIKLDVASYCAECLRFSPDVERPQVLVDSETGEISSRSDTVIRCSNRDSCQELYDYIKKECETGHDSIL